MASRTELISVTCYDNDGGLDWSWNGSQWFEWYTWQRGLGRQPDIIAQDLRIRFEKGLSSAIISGEELLRLRRKTEK